MEIITVREFKGNRIGARNWVDVRLDNARMEVFEGNKMAVLRTITMKNNSIKEFTDNYIECANQTDINFLQDNPIKNFDRNTLIGFRNFAINSSLQSFSNNNLSTTESLRLQSV